MVVDLEMEVGINLNENYEVTAFFFDNESGDLRISISNDLITEINQGNLFKYQNNELIRDTNKENHVTKIIEIETLKQKLVETDYIVTKSMEYQLTGKSIPDEYNQILINRDSWRNRINILQSEMEELKEEK